MIFLILCIISSSLLMVTFKVAGIRNLDNFKVIVINYVVAALFGFIIGGFPDKSLAGESWLPASIVIGILFIVIFLVMAKSTQLSGISSTTVASKMSVIIPILFSIIYFGENVSLLKIGGISLALASVFLSIYKNESNEITTKTSFILPLMLFVGTGIIDSSIKFTQESYLGNESSMIFTSTLFMFAAISGLIYAPFRAKNLTNWFHKETLIAGIILGIINFGSLYGIVMALESNVFDSSIIFGINNIGIVLLSVTFATILFKENLSQINRVGIALSLLSIILLTIV